mgnify:FL=1
MIVVKRRKVNHQPHTYGLATGCLSPNETCIATLSSACKLRVLLFDQEADAVKDSTLLPRHYVHSLERVRSAAFRHLEIEFAARRLTTVECSCTQSIVSGTSTWDVLVSLQHRQAHGACVAVPVALGLLENQQVSTALAGGFLSAVASILRCDCARCDRRAAVRC